MIRVAVIELGNSRLCVLCVYAVHQAPPRHGLCELRTGTTVQAAGIRPHVVSTCRRRVVSVLVIFRILMRRSGHVLGQLHGHVLACGEI